MINNNNFYKNKTILVSGGAGSIGFELTKSLLKLSPKIIRVYDNNEGGIFNLKNVLKSKKVRFMLGDIRDKNRLLYALNDVDVVFHTAALKHVSFCEENPFEAVKTNIIGTQNLLEASLESKVDKVIAISTDKAVNPLNVMGATKLLVERLVMAVSNYKGKRNTQFSCVRFGNVLASAGSVIPIFKEQIEKGGPVTVTNPKMSRFAMSIPQAVKLILEAGEKAKDQEIFVLKMPVVNIMDLAETMIENLAKTYGFKPEDIKIKIIGSKIQEKMHEEIANEYEKRMMSEYKNMYVIRYSKPVKNTKISKYKTKQLSKSQIKKLLRDNQII